MYFMRRRTDLADRDLTKESGVDSAPEVLGCIASHFKRNKGFSNSSLELPETLCEARREAGNWPFSHCRHRHVLIQYAVPFVTIQLYHVPQNGGAEKLASRIPPNAS